MLNTQCLLDQESEEGFVRSKGFKGEAMRELATEVLFLLQLTCAITPIPMGVSD